MADRYYFITEANFLGRTVAGSYGATSEDKILSRNVIEERLHAADTFIVRRRDTFCSTSLNAPCLKVTPFSCLLKSITINI